MTGSHLLTALYEITISLLFEIVLIHILEESKKHILNEEYEIFVTAHLKAAT